MMAVRIGHASIDEHGRVQGGTAGDQSGKEVKISNYYVHKKGWVVLRCKDSAKRLLIAEAMERACNNSQIGYDQYQRDTLFNNVRDKGFDPSRTTKSVETDCSALVRVCIAYAYGYDVVGNIRTVSEPSMLVNSKQFTKLTESKYCKSSEYLCRGDILCTPVSGHTVVVLDDGPKSEDSSVTAAPGTSYSSTSASTSSDQNGTTNYNDVAFNYATQGYTSLPQEYLSSEHLYPYVVTVDRNTVLSSDYARLADVLREQRICGAVVEAGYLFDSLHLKRNFKSPKFYEQIKLFDAMDLPYGLWMTCRARTATEAKQEMEELRKCVQVAKLNLGVWLDLKFDSTQSKVLNDEMITLYRKALHEMGLAGKIGFYVTPSQLSTVTWENHQNDWLLWLIERLQREDQLDMDNKLFVPDFWNVEHVRSSSEQTVDPGTVGLNFGQPYPFPSFS